MHQARRAVAARTQLAGGPILSRLSAAGERALQRACLTLCAPSLDSQRELFPSHSQTSRLLHQRRTVTPVQSTSIAVKATLATSPSPPSQSPSLHPARGPKFCHEPSVRRCIFPSRRALKSTPSAPHPRRGLGPARRTSTDHADGPQALPPGARLRQCPVPGVQAALHAASPAEHVAVRQSLPVHRAVREGLED